VRIVTPGTPIPGAALLPTDCERDGADTQTLRRDVAAFIHQYVELPADSIPVVVAYVFLSWAFDAFFTMPEIFPKIPFIPVKAEDSLVSSGMGAISSFVKVPIKLMDWFVISVI